jgi:hypothetical protein
MQPSVAPASTAPSALKLWSVLLLLLLLLLLLWAGPLAQASPVQSCCWGCDRCYSSTQAGAWSKKGWLAGVSSTPQSYKLAWDASGEDWGVWQCRTSLARRHCTRTARSHAFSFAKHVCVAVDPAVRFSSDISQWAWFCLRFNTCLLGCPAGCCRYCFGERLARDSTAPHICAYAHWHRHVLQYQLNISLTAPRWYGASAGQLSSSHARQTA